MEKTIKMYKGQYQMLIRDKDGKIIEVTIPGYTFSFLGVDFGCSNMRYIAETGELQKDEKNWILVDIETKLVCGRCASRRGFSYLLTPEYVNRIKEIKKKRKLYKSEN